MNWTTVLTQEAGRNSILRTDALARKYGLSEPVVRNALRRYESKQLVERVSTKIYTNHFNQRFSPRDLVNILRPRSYISLESALVDRGIITQSPSILTCVTPGYPHKFRGKSVVIVYRKISPDLYWGFEEKATRYNKYLIAEPEKALLDWIYLNRQGRAPNTLRRNKFTVPCSHQAPSICATLPSYGKRNNQGSPARNGFPITENTRATHRGVR
jgi:predicted transcriptional regulator of viral defense system